MYTTKLSVFWHFYLHPLLVPPLLALPWVLRRRANRWLLCAGLLISLGTALYPFYFPHYSAPVAGILVLLIVEGLRRLAVWNRRLAAGGLSLTALIVASLVVTGGLSTLLAFLLHRRAPVTPESLHHSRFVARQQIDDRLTATGGKHLVLVRYGPEHIFHFSAVNNRAKIDEAAVV